MLLISPSPVAERSLDLRLWPLVYTTAGWIDIKRAICAKNSARGQNTDSTEEGRLSAVPIWKRAEFRLGLEVFVSSEPEGRGRQRFQKPAVSSSRHPSVRSEAIFVPASGCALRRHFGMACISPILAPSAYAKGVRRRVIDERVGPSRAHRDLFIDHLPCHSGPSQQAVHTIAQGLGYIRPSGKHLKLEA